MHRREKNVNSVSVMHINNWDGIVEVKLILLLNLSQKWLFRYNGSVEMCLCHH